MEGIEEIAIMVMNDQPVLDKVKDAERIANSSFFPPGKIPKRYHSKKAENGKTYATAYDVERYILDKKATMDAFVDEPLFKCKSFYNICE